MKPFQVGNLELLQLETSDIGFDIDSEDTDCETSSDFDFSDFDSEDMDAYDWDVYWGLSSYED